MNHDRIEIELTDWEPGGEKRQTIILSDTKGLKHNVIAREEGVIHYKEILHSQNGKILKRNNTFYPWHRIREIRYFGER